MHSFKEMYDALTPMRRFIEGPEKGMVCVTALRHFEAALAHCLYHKRGNPLPPLVLYDCPTRDSLPEATSTLASLYGVDVLCADSLPQYPETIIYAYIPPDRKQWRVFSPILQALANLGLRRIACNTSATQLFSRTYALMDQLPTNKANQVYSLLTDAKSREIYVRLLKARLTGKAEYIEASPDMEYTHPQVPVVLGDHVLDGGLMGDFPTREFALRTGPTGSVIGFEAFPQYATACTRLLRSFPWVRVFNKGLWSCTKTMFFGGEGGTVRVLESPSPTARLVECIALDDFLEETTSVSLVKLDIEGAEMKALQGMKRLLRHNRPKLMISLYHKPEDMFDIPLQLAKWLPDYQFYVGHHTHWFAETCLYGKPNELNQIQTSMYGTSDALPERLKGKEVLFVGGGAVYQKYKASFVNCKPQAILVDDRFLPNIPECLDGIPVKTFADIDTQKMILPCVFFCRKQYFRLLFSRVITHLDTSVEDMVFVLEE